MRLSIYIHIPFCLRKCLYCDFASTVDATIGHEEYTAALIREMECRALALEEPAEAITLYFGGGTPSLFAPELIRSLIDSANRLFSLTSDAEITLEANPGTVTPEKLKGYREAGVNRLSLGVQSLDDRMLSLLGRIHTAQQAYEAVEAARKAGFTNLGIDLIHSLPGQTLIEWEAELRRALLLQPDHISAYGLSIEEGTPFHAMSERGELSLPDQDVAADMICKTWEMLGSHGFEYYEISNFAKPGYHSRHNQVYWQRGDYLGFGAAAHSFLRKPDYGIRWSNPPAPADYLHAVNEGCMPEADSTPLTLPEAMSEYLFLGFRLLDGVDQVEFEAEFGKSLFEVYNGVIEKSIGDGLLTQAEGRLRLTGKGLLLSNRVFAEFV